MDYLDEIILSLMPPEQPLPFGKTIQKLRQLNKWTHQDVRDYLDATITVQDLQDIEAGILIPKPWTTVKLAELFRLDIDQFIQFAKECKLAQLSAELDEDYKRALRKLRKGNVDS